MMSNIRDSVRGQRHNYEKRAIENKLIRYAIIGRSAYSGSESSREESG